MGWNREREHGWLRPTDGDGESVYFRASSVCNWDAKLIMAAGMGVQYRPATNSRGAVAYHVYVLPDDEAAA